MSSAETLSDTPSEKSSEDTAPYCLQCHLPDHAEDSCTACKICCRLGHQDDDCPYIDYENDNNVYCSNCGEEHPCTECSVGCQIEDCASPERTWLHPHVASDMAAVDKAWIHGYAPAKKSSDALESIEIKAFNMSNQITHQDRPSTAFASYQGPTDTTYLTPETQETSVVTNYVTVTPKITDVFVYSMVISSSSANSQPAERENVFAALCEQQPLQGRDDLSTDYETLWVGSALQGPLVLDNVSYLNQNGQNVVVPHIEFKYQRRLDFSNGSADLTGAAKSDRNPAELKRALDGMITRSIVTKNQDTLSQSGSNELFIKSKGPQLDVDVNNEPIYNALHIRRGYSASVRPGADDVLLNVEIVHKTFLKPMIVSDLIDEMESHVGDAYGDYVNYLKGRTVRIMYDRPTLADGIDRDIEVNRIKTISDSGEVPQNQQFERDGKMRSVKEWFETQGIEINRVDMVCFNVGTSFEPFWIPAELIELMPNQPFGGELSEKHAKIWSDIADQHPAMNHMAIQEEGLPLLESGGLDRSLFLEVGKSLLQVPATFPTAPVIQYQDGAPKKVVSADWDVSDGGQKPTESSSWDTIDGSQDGGGSWDTTNFTQVGAASWDVDDGAPKAVEDAGWGMDAGAPKAVERASWATDDGAQKQVANASSAKDDVHQDGARKHVKNASWDMDDVHFIKPAMLINSKLCVLDFRAPDSKPSPGRFAQLWMESCESHGLFAPKWKISRNEAENVISTEAVLPSKEGGMKSYFHDLRETIETFRKSLEAPNFVAVILPEFDATAYAAIKRIADVKLGIHTICCVASTLVGEELGPYDKMSLEQNLKAPIGRNHAVMNEEGVSAFADLSLTLVIGVDVVHAGGDTPSIVSMVGSTDADFATFPGRVRLQPAQHQALDRRTARELVQDCIVKWKKAHPKKKPSRIIYYRDGVDEDQYDLVMKEEVNGIEEAIVCEVPGFEGVPITIIVVSTQHHTSFFAPNDSMTYEDENGHDSQPPGFRKLNGNIRPGLLVDSVITQPSSSEFQDFFLQSHVAATGTARPAHYTVLRNDEQKSLNFQQLQVLTHAFCYNNATDTKALSYCSPAYYADRLCDRALQYMNSYLSAEKPRLKQSEEETLLAFRERIRDRIMNDPEWMALGNTNPWHSDLDDTMFWL